MLKYIISIVVTMILLLIISRWIKSIMVEGMEGRKIVLKTEVESGEVPMPNAGACGVLNRRGKKMNKEWDAEMGKLWRMSDLKNACTCEKACMDDENCNSWTFSIVDGKPKCTLTDGYTLEEADDMTRGGVVNPSPDVNDPMIKYRNKYYTWSRDKVLKSVDGVNAASNCQTECGNAEGCSAWSYTREGCVLLKDVYNRPARGGGDYQYAGFSYDLERYSKGPVIDINEAKDSKIDMGNIDPKKCALECDKNESCLYWQKLNKPEESCWLITTEMKGIMPNISSEEGEVKAFSGVRQVEVAPAPTQLDVDLELKNSKESKKSSKTKKNKK